MKLLKIFLFLFLAASGFTQTALMPMPRQCFNDNLSAGQPLAGGKIFTYQAGTSVQQATFTDATGLTQNTNPVILDAAGCTSIWLTSGQAYRFVAQNSSGAQEWVTDSVSGLATTVSAFAQATTTVAFSATPTFTATGQQQVFKITLTGNVTSSTLAMAGVTAPSLVSFEITEDNTGGRTFVWPLNVANAAPLNTAANAITTETFFWDGTTAWAVNNLSATLTGNNFFQGNNTLSGNNTFSGVNQFTANTFLTVPKATNVVTQTGDTSAHTIYTIPIPAGAMGPNNQLRITLLFAANVNAGSSSVKMSYGATQITPSVATSVNLNNNNGIYFIVMGGNLGATNSQSWDALVSNNFSNVGNGNVYHATSAIDSTVIQNLTVTFQGGANSDSFTFYRCIVEIL